MCVLVTGQELVTLRKRLRFFFPQRLSLEGAPKALRNRNLVTKSIPENSRIFCFPYKKKRLSIILLFCILHQYLLVAPIITIY